jgi:CheY-like chemotaxis protein
VTVLCVEHHPASLNALQCRLENAGYQVISASNGREAVSSFAAQSVDSVLLEYDLPDRTGTEVREEMKSIKPGIPVLLFAGIEGSDECGSSTRSQSRHSRRSDRFRSSTPTTMQTMATSFCLPGLPVYARALTPGALHHSTA